MSESMEDATDFTWQGAKAAYSVLLCEMERGTVAWEENHRTDGIRHTHAQKHSHGGSKFLGKTD